MLFSQFGSTVALEMTGPSGYREEDVVSGVQDAAVLRVSGHSMRKSRAEQRAGKVMDEDRRCPFCIVHQINQSIQAGVRVLGSSR